MPLSHNDKTRHPLTWHRWGRTYEGFSEDPAITRIYAQEMVAGLQNLGPAPDPKKPYGVLATAKHFLGDGGTWKGIDQGVNLSPEALLINLHGQGYFGALSAGAQTIMVSFNSWIPAPAGRPRFMYPYGYGYGYDPYRDYYPVYPYYPGPVFLPAETLYGPEAVKRFMGADKMNQPAPRSSTSRSRTAGARGTDDEQAVIEGQLDQVNHDRTVEQ